MLQTSRSPREDVRPSALTRRNFVRTILAGNAVSAADRIAASRGL